MDFRLDIPDPLSRERELLIHCLVDARQAAVNEMREQYPNPVHWDLINHSVETAMLNTMTVLDGATPGLNIHSTNYVLLPANIVVPTNGDSIMSLAGGLHAMMKREFDEIND